MINPNNYVEMPPWAALPAPVRERINQRMRERYGPEDDDQTIEGYRQDLRNLSALRLIDAYGLKKAMRKGRDYPAFGPDPQAWLAARSRCLAALEEQARDPVFIERARWLLGVVQEELAKYSP